MGSDKHLKLRATPDSGLGRVITHMQNGLTSQQELAAATLLARFLPFAIDKDHPQFREIAIRCANECEAWGKIIREYALLGVPTSFSSLEIMGQSSHPTHNSIAHPDNQDDTCSEEEELDPELDERLRRRRKNPMGF
ncbi:MAG: hypothetical protein QNJ53_01825 [Pleurocapsa sp. MO_192.B19]|nr:hypothetical protein [Pleurocapsa sp. MO_192.B19]